MPCKQEVAEQLGARISELCSYIYAAEHRLLTLIREFDEQEGWAHLGFHSCAYWLNFKCGIDMNTAHHVEKLVRLYRRAERLQDTEAAKERHDNRQMSYHYDHYGYLVIKGRFPGCTNDKFVDGHHIEHWADGGETNLDNLVLLCRHHHHLVHEGGFSCEKTASGELIFKNRRNTPLPHWSLLPTVGDDDINDWLERKFFDRGIDADTCRSQWYAGERMDWNLAVGHLFNRSTRGVPADHVPSG